MILKSIFKICIIIAFLKEFPNPKFNSQSKEKITNSNTEMTNYLGDIDYENFVKKILKNKDIIDPITEVYKIKEELKRRQEMKSLNTPKKIKNDKYLPAIGESKYVKSVNNLTPDPNTGSIYISQVNSAVTDGNGANIANTYVKLATPQTITAQHNFSSGIKISGIYLKCSMLI